jgi:hypothetical protein
MFYTIAPHFAGLGRPPHLLFRWRSIHHLQANDLKPVARFGWNYPDYFHGFETFLYFLIQSSFGGDGAAAVKPGARDNVS